MKLAIPRAGYAPAGTPSVVLGGGLLEVFQYERAGVPYAVGFLGKAQRPTFNYRFRDDARRQAYIAEQIDAAASLKVHREQRAAARRGFVHSLTVGAILHTSWGYEQTNVEYFEVTEVRGADVIVRELAQNRTETGFMSGRCSPRPGEYCGPPIRKRVLRNNTLKMSDWGRYAFEGGGERYWSSYA